MNQYTLEEVSKHNKEDDMWIIINEYVYDITNFMSEHPGGKQILMNVAGKDATEYFEELHNPKVLKEVAEDYKIGTLQISNHCCL